MVALVAPRAASEGWIPFVGSPEGYSSTEILLEALPLALGLGLWPLIALLVTAQAFAGDRASGTESFLLERPVSRTRVWIARSVASFGSTGLVATVSFLLWLAVASMVVTATAEKWSVAMKVLLGGGSLAAIACLLGGMIAASLLSAPLAALLLGIVLVAVPVCLTTLLGSWTAAATVADLPIGLFFPGLLLLVYPVASWIAVCRGEPAGRGRILRGTTAIAAGALALGLVFVVAAPTVVRAVAGRLEYGADVAPSPAGPSAYFGSSRQSSGGWIVDLSTGDRLEFLAPPVWQGGWSEDGTRMAALTMSGPLGSASPALRIEFHDAWGRSAGRTLHYDDETWASRARWAGNRLVLYELRVVDERRSFRFRVYDPDSGNERSAAAPEYLRMADLVGPTDDGRLFAVIREVVEADDDGEPGSPYGLYPIDLDTAEVGERPLLEDVGQAWGAGTALSPSGRYWIVDRRAGRHEVRPVLDLDTGEEIEVEGLVRDARWLEGDALVWVETHGSEKHLVMAEPRGPRRELGTWRDRAVDLQVSPDRTRLLVNVFNVLDALGGAILERQIVESRIYEPADDRWIDLAVWPEKPYEGYLYSTTWAGPRTIARTGPHVLAFEQVERPGALVPVIGSIRTASD
jgi:hypothetical protein